MAELAGHLVASPSAYRAIVRRLPYPLKMYLFVWAAWLILWLINPVSYNGGNVWGAISLLFIFVAVSVFVALGMQGVFISAPRVRLARPRPGLGVKELSFILKISILLSFIGTACLFYDRMVIQGIDYSHGIAVARSTWNNEEKLRGGISSWASVVGYLIGSDYFVTAVLCFLHWEWIPGKLRARALFAVVVLLGLNSFLLGGRSIVMMIFCALFATGMLRHMYGRPFLPGRKRTHRVIGLIVLVGISYSMYVFHARAVASDMAPVVYARNNVLWLGGKPTSTFDAIGSLNKPVADVLYLSVQVDAYLTHSLGILQLSMVAPNRPGTASFNYARELLSRIGIPVSGDENWLFAGKFITMPGSIWYDFGWSGVILAAVVLGLSLGLCQIMVANRNAAGIGVVFALAIWLTALLAPLLISVDIMSFPWMVLGFIEMSALAFVRYGGHSWLEVAERDQRRFRLNERKPEAQALALRRN